MLRIAILVFTISYSMGASAQHVSLFWYNLVSLEQLDAADGKEVVTLIAELVDDSLLTYNVKSSMFQLATKSPLELNTLTDHLNSEGYFIADISGGLLHQTNAVKSGFNFQVALFYFRNNFQFGEIGIDQITLNLDEVQLLQEEYLYDPLEFSEFSIENN